MLLKPFISENKKSSPCETEFYVKVAGWQRNQNFLTGRQRSRSNSNGVNAKFIGYRMNYIAFGATIKWAFRFAEPAEGPLKSELSLLLASTGTWSISFAQSARSHSWVIVITRRRISPTVKPTTISYLVISASFATK